MTQETVPEILTDPDRRHDFVMLFDVTMGNPNGDPDAENLPRVDPETMHGIVTDVAIKRKIRNYAQLVAGKDIFIQNQTSLNSLIVKGFRDTGVQPPEIQLEDDELQAWFEENNPEGWFSLAEGGVLIYGGETKKAAEIKMALLQDVPRTTESLPLRKNLEVLAEKLAKAAKTKIGTQQRDEARKQLCKDYYDIRLFGAVLATGPLNAGQVRGPLQLTFARSVDPVFQHNITITRQARTTWARMATGGTEMGRKAIVPYGLYRAHGFFSPQLGKTTGVTSDDLKTLWQAIGGGMWEIDRSAARPEMSTRALYVFSHDSPLGNAPAHKLFERVTVARKGGVEASRSFGDYSVDVRWDQPNGVTLTRHVDDKVAVGAADGRV